MSHLYSINLSIKSGNSGIHCLNGIYRASGIYRTSGICRATVIYSASGTYIVYTERAVFIDTY